MWEFMVKGGIVMAPLALCSVIALVIVIERIIFFLRTYSRDGEKMISFKALFQQKNIDDLKRLIALWNSPLGRVASAVVRQWQSDPKNRELLEAVAQTTGEEELKHLQRGMGLLDTIVTACPLLGLLGTVIGIIKAFTALSVTSDISQSAQLSAGIAEALYNTAFGLAIAIPVLFCVNIFYSIAERRARVLNNHCEELLAVFVEANEK